MLYDWIQYFQLELIFHTSSCGLSHLRVLLAVLTALTQFSLTTRGTNRVQIVRLGGRDGMSQGVESLQAEWCCWNLCYSFCWLHSSSVQAYALVEVMTWHSLSKTPCDWLFLGQCMCSSLSLANGCEWSEYRSLHRVHWAVSESSVVCDQFLNCAWIPLDLMD